MQRQQTEARNRKKQTKIENKRAWCNAQWRKGNRPTEKKGNKRERKKERKGKKRNVKEKWKKVKGSGRKRNLGDKRHSVDAEA